MSQPCLQLEERHGLLGVIELGGDRRPSPVAGNRAPGICLRHSSLPTEHRDERLIEVQLPKPPVSMGEEIVRGCTSCGIGQRLLLGPHRLPPGYRLTNQAIHRLGEASARLFDRHVEQADRSVLSAGRLPANATHRQAAQLVVPQTSEQPACGHRTYEFGRILTDRRSRAADQVTVGEVEPSPHKLRPDIVGDDAGVGRDQRPGRPRG